jgi:uncharacterized membrane protein YdjX (TVP38/TMEM64 family)
MVSSTISSNKPQPPTDDNSTNREKPLAHILRDMTSRPMPRGIAVALLVALAISALSITLMNHFGGATRVRDWIQGAGVWAPLAYIGLKAATSVIAPLSGTPVKLAGGALFGFWDGAIFVLAGDMLGAVLNFWIARLFRDRGITRFAGKAAIKQIDLLTENVGGWRALLAARLFLSSLYDFISYAAGLSGLPFRQFFWVSLLAGIPSTLLAAWLGNAAVTNKPFLYITFGVSALALLVIIFTQSHSKSKISQKKSAVDEAVKNTD